MLRTKRNAAGRQLQALVRQHSIYSSTSNSMKQLNSSLGTCFSSVAISSGKVSWELQPSHSPLSPSSVA